MNQIQRYRFVVERDQDGGFIRAYASPWEGSREPGNDWVTFFDHEHALGAQEAILRKCLRQLDPAPDEQRSRLEGGLVPCLLYSCVPGEIRKLQQENAALKAERDSAVRTALEKTKSEASLMSEVDTLKALLERAAEIVLEVGDERTFYEIQACLRTSSAPLVGEQHAPDPVLYVYCSSCGCPYPLPAGPLADKCLLCGAEGCMGGPGTQAEIMAEHCLTEADFDRSAEA